MEQAQFEKFIQEEKKFFIRHLDINKVLEKEGFIKRTTAFGKNHWVKKGEVINVSQNNRTGEWSWSIVDSGPEKPKNIIELYTQKDHAFSRELLKDRATVGVNAGTDQYKTIYLKAIDRLRELSRELVPSATHSKFYEPYAEVVGAIQDSAKSKSQTEQMNATQGQAPLRNSEKTFLLKEVSLFKVAVEYGYAPKQFMIEGNIPNEVVFEVKRKANIVAVAKTYLRDMEKNGDVYLASNPLKQSGQKTLVINPEKNSFYDTRSELKGDAITILTTFAQQPYKKAIRTLADELRIPIPSIEKESSTYYVKGDSKLSIKKAEDSGLYLFYNATTKQGGTLDRFVKEEKHYTNDNQVLNEMRRLAVRHVAPEKIQAFKEETGISVLPPLYKVSNIKVDYQLAKDPQFGTLLQDMAMAYRLNRDFKLHHDYRALQTVWVEHFESPQKNQMFKEAERQVGETKAADLVRLSLLEVALEKFTAQDFRSAFTAGDENSKAFITHAAVLQKSMQQPKAVEVPLDTKLYDKFNVNRQEPAHTQVASTVQEGAGKQMKIGGIL